MLIVIAENVLYAVLTNFVDLGFELCVCFLERSHIVQASLKLFIPPAYFVTGSDEVCLAPRRDLCRSAPVCPLSPGTSTTPHLYFSVLGLLAHGQVGPQIC